MVDITIKVALITSSAANITFVVAKIIFKVAVITSSVAKFTFYYVWAMPKHNKNNLAMDLASFYYSM